MSILGVWNESIEIQHFPLTIFFLFLLFLFSFSLSFHVSLSNQFTRAPNSESYEFIIRPCCVIEGVFNFMQMISNSSILGSKFWKENWGPIFEAFWKSFGTKKIFTIEDNYYRFEFNILHLISENDNYWVAAKGRIENNRHLDCRKCLFVSLSLDYISRAPSCLQRQWRT